MAEAIIEDETKIQEQLIELQRDCSHLHIVSVGTFPGEQHLCVFCGLLENRPDTGWFKILTISNAQNVSRLLAEQLKAELCEYEIQTTIQVKPKYIPA